jgi:hypothetical protein
MSDTNSLSDIFFVHFAATVQYCLINYLGKAMAQNLITTQN